MIEEIAPRYANTVVLGLAAIVVAVILGGVTGILSAVYRGGWIDQLSLSVSLLGVSMPTFFLGLLLMMLFSAQLGLLPLSGFDDWDMDPRVLLGLSPRLGSKRDDA